MSYRIIEYTLRAEIWVPTKTSSSLISPPPGQAPDEKNQNKNLRLGWEQSAERPCWCNLRCQPTTGCKVSNSDGLKATCANLGDEDQDTGQLRGSPSGHDPDLRALV